MADVKLVRRDYNSRVGEALDRLVAEGRVAEWSFGYRNEMGGRMMYRVDGVDMTPGEAGELAGVKFEGMFG